MVRFNETEIRSMGRGTSGVKGIDLTDSEVVSSEIINSGEEILIVTEKGYGKKTLIDEYRLTHRGSKGVKALNITEKNGNMVALKYINPIYVDKLDVMIITDSGIIMRMPLSQISTLKRATQGNRLINLKENQKVATIAIVEKEVESDQEEEKNQ